MRTEKLFALNQTPVNQGFWQWLTTDLSHRTRQPEIMDQNDLSTEELSDALDGLRRIGRLSGIARRYWQIILPWHRARGESKLAVLDLASGGGEILRELAKKSTQAGMVFVGTGIDKNKQSCLKAAGSFETRATVSFLEQDLADESDLLVECSVITCSLFLHHLTDTEVIMLFRKIGRSTAKLVIINDLIRSRWGGLLAWLGTRLVGGNWIVKADGATSVRAAFSKPELQSLLASAGISRAIVKRVWPERWLIVWEQA